MKNLLFTLIFSMCCVIATAQERYIITGTVSDEIGPMMGCNVTEIDKNNRIIKGTATNMEGEYALTVQNPANRLRFSYIGCKTKTVAINGRHEINVTMETDGLTLQETVVTAKRRASDESFNIAEREVSQAIGRFDLKEAEGLSIGSADDVLQGRIAGLDIVGGGTPGQSGQMRVRGTSTILGNAEPLIVVNDIPFESTELSNFDASSATDEQYADLLNVNVDDIQEITVLKDAASAAMWGSRGANGVIIIRTKRGAMGKTRVSYSYKLTSATQPSGYSLLSGDDFSMMMKQAYFNMSQLSGSSSHSDYDFPEFAYNQNWSEYQMFNNNTDWASAVTQKAWTHDHYVTVQGGGESANFYVSGGYYNRTGTTIGQKYERYSTRAQLDYRVSDRFLVRTEFQFTYGNNNQNYAGLLDIAYKKMPNLSVFRQDNEGNDLEEYYNIPTTSNMSASQKNLLNPVAVGNLAKDKTLSYRILPTLRLQYDFFDPEKFFLRYNGYISFDLNTEHRERHLPSECGNYTWDNSQTNATSDVNNNILTMMTENKLTYRSTFANKDHDLQAMASWNTSQSRSTSQSTTSYGHPSSGITDALSTAILPQLTNGNSESRSMSMLTRVHYAYKGKYIFDATLRMDGSTKFGDNNRYGWFPGLSAKWIISDEKFWKPLLNVVSMFAVRPSYGESGRQPSSNYLHLNRLAIDQYGYMDMSAAYPSNIRLTDLRWERISSGNLGVDVELFDGKVALTGDIYHKRTNDMLFPSLSIATSSGYSALTYKNVGVMDNDGWEMTVSLNKIITAGKFDASFNFNAASNKNTIREMDKVVLDKYNNVTSFTNTSAYPTRLQVNNSIGSIYGFRYMGVYAYSYDKYDKAIAEDASCAVAKDKDGKVISDNNGKPKAMYYYFNSTAYQFQGGDAIYEDINSDGTIDENDLVYLGNCNPKLSGGFGMNLHYDNIYLTLFFNYRYGNKIINQARRSLENMYNGYNQCTTVNWRWRKEGDVTEVPRAVYQEAYNSLPSDRYVEDGSYMRLKYVTLRYQAKPKWMKRTFISSASVYLTVNNLFCITKYSGVDPEVSIGSFGVCTDNSATPRSKDWMLGVQLSF